MDWQQLRYFLAVAESGSLAGGARRLGVSKATVWRQVRALERALDATLLEQNPSGQILTEAGQRFLASVEGINRTIEAACKSLSAPSAPVAGEVRVTSPELLGNLIIGGIPDLLARHPGLAVELITGSPAAGLAARDTDISLRFEEPRGVGFTRAASYPIRFAVYAAPSYIERFGAPTKIDAFAGHRLIDFEHSLGQLAPTVWRQRGGRDAEIVFRSNSPHLRLAAARAGIGLALLTEPFVGDDPVLRKVLGGETIGSLELLMLVSNQLWHESRVVAVRNFLNEILEKATSDSVLPLRRAHR